MKQINVFGQRIIRVALIASMAFGGFPAMHAQQKVAATSAAGRREKPAGGRTEGIKVHGHWTIVIRNADGSVASHNEFENAFIGGNAVIADLLSRKSTPGLWHVVISIQSSTNSPAETMILAEPTSTAATSTTTFKNLQVSSDPLGLHLTGSGRTIDGAARIANVSTGVNICPNTTAPASPCPDVVSSASFTGTALSPAISVSANQSVDVSVTISFS
jgi:hypothetical protein